MQNITARVIHGFNSAENKMGAFSSYAILPVVNVCMDVADARDISVFLCRTQDRYEMRRNTPIKTADLSSCICKAIYTFRDAETSLVQILSSKIASLPDADEPLRQTETSDTHAVKR